MGKLAWTCACIEGSPFSSDSNWIQHHVCSSSIFTVPRRLRVESPGGIHHVMSRGDQREDIFRDDVACAMGYAPPSTRNAEERGGKTAPVDQDGCGARCPRGQDYGLTPIPFL